MAGNLKLENYSDREVLHIINDLADEAGWVEVELLAERIGISAAGMSEAQLALHAVRCVSVRLAWIKKLSGTVERDPVKANHRWRLTTAGHALVTAKLTAEVKAKLSTIDEFSTLIALDTISRRYQRADVKAANLMRREWVYGTHKNRRAN